jgi:hypothetical protein
MQYHYTRAFIAEGTLARKSQEIVLFDEPGEGMRFVLSGAPDSYLTDSDKISAAGLRVFSRITVAGAPPPPPMKAVGEIVDEIRSKRRQLLDNRMVLVCQIDDTADPLNAPGSCVVEGDRFAFINRGEVDKIIKKHEREIYRALASLFAADPLVMSFEPLAESFKFTSREGLETLAVTLGGTASCVTRTGTDAEKENKVKRGFERCFRSDKNLKTVTRLLSDSLLAKDDKLRSFLAAWTSLEIFARKFYKNQSTPPPNTEVEKDEDEEKTTSEPEGFLVFQFNSAVKNLRLDNPAARERDFKRIKKVREKLVHGKEVDEASLPVEETQALVRAFLERV